MSKTVLFLRLSTASYIVLVLTLAYWFYLSIPTLKSPVIIGAVLAFLLLSPIPGIIKQRPYTFAWASMLVLVYFTHSTIELWANNERFTLALIELIASSIFICCAGLYARYRSRELKQQATS